MKKILITILMFLYLASGIGVSGVHQSCQNKQEMVSPCDSQCCSEKSLTESSTANHHPEESEANSCCDIMDTSVPTMSCAHSVPGNCCKIQHKHNQLDSSSLLLNIDVNIVPKSSDKFYYYPQHPKNIDGCALKTFSDPSTHLNLPLLI